jgi:putative transposase
MDRLVENPGRTPDAGSRAHADPDPTKQAVSQVVGFIKGKSAIEIALVYGERKRNFVRQHFWGRGYFVNTVGRDEEATRACICNQLQEDQKLEQLNLWY